MEQIKSALINSQITDLWWFEIIIAIIAASLASLFTYAYVKKAAKIAEINRLIDNTILDMRLFIEQYKVLSTKDIRDKMSMPIGEVETRVNDLKARLNRDVRLLDSLLTKRLSENYSDFHEYTKTILVDIYDTKKSQSEKNEQMCNSGERLERLLVTVHYEINNSWLVIKWNRHKFKRAKGKEEYNRLSGDRYITNTKDV